jgi:hypothetical protein
VEGQKLTGRHVYLSDTGFPKLKLAREVIALYPVGTDVAVHYDPANPKRACLQPVRREFRALGIAAFLGTIGLAALITG